MKQLKVVWSTSKPVEEEKGKRKRAEEPTIPQPSYFPVSMLVSPLFHLVSQLRLSRPSMFGFVPFPEDSIAFPCNVNFEHADIMTMDVVSSSYDVILALSLTKWIHLNQGDEGIMSFFKRVYDMLISGGVLVLEAQLIKSYQNAVSDMHVSKALK